MVMSHSTSRVALQLDFPGSGLRKVPAGAVGGGESRVVEAGGCRSPGPRLCGRGGVGGGRGGQARAGRDVGPGSPRSRPPAPEHPPAPARSRVSAPGRRPARRRRGARAGAVHVLLQPDIPRILRLLERPGAVALGALPGLSSSEHLAGFGLAAPQRTEYADSAAPLDAGALSMFRRGGLGIDLGTTHTVVHHWRRGVVFDEPSILVLAARRRLRPTVVSLGSEALTLAGRAPAGLEVVRPMRDGAVRDLEHARAFLRAVLKPASAGVTWTGRRQMPQTAI